MTTDEIQSRNAEHIYYRPQRRASRKGAHERTVGHEWRCRECNTLVHEEPLVGFDHEETTEEVAARQLRIAEACAGHSPCPKSKSRADSEASSDDDEDDDGTSGQDRESYTDEQDRESYVCDR